MPGSVTCCVACAVCVGGLITVSNLNLSMFKLMLGLVLTIFCYHFAGPGGCLLWSPVPGSTAHLGFQVQV